MISTEQVEQILVWGMVLSFTIVTLAIVFLAFGGMATELNKVPEFKAVKVWEEGACSVWKIRDEGRFVWFERGCG